MLVLDRDDVRALLDLDGLIDALAGAMADLSDGAASAPPRIAAFVAEREAFCGVMPAYVPSLNALTAKLVTLFPHNAGSTTPTHQAVIVAFDPETGSPVALLDGTEITAVRTAAGSALSARLLARDDAAVLAIVGTGVQAREHARLVPRVRRITEIRLAGRDPRRTEELAAELGARAAGSAEEAIRGADIVCATTSSREPVIRREWLDPGVHVTSVGFNTAGREVDAETVAAALVCVESRPTALAPPPAGSNDLEGASADEIVEIGELVLGRREGRTDDGQITLYKSVGVAVQDAAGAALVLAAARERGVGTELELA